MADVDVRALMKSIPDRFLPEAAKGVDAVIQFMYSGEQASDWVMVIKDQTCKVEEGKDENPDLTLKADAEDGVNVLLGQLDGMRAYMLGKIKVYGDLSLAMKLMNFFDVSS